MADEPVETPLPAPDAPEQQVVSVGDIINRLQMAARKKKYKMPHRLLLMNAAYALQQLVKRIDFHESQQKVS